MDPLAASTHAATIFVSRPLARFLIAMIAWPIITAVPAFITERPIKSPRRC